MTAPSYAPVDRHYDATRGATFTYRWGARSVGIDSFRQFGRMNGLVVACGSLVFFLFGAMMFKPYGRTAWVPIGIGAAALLGGIGLICQKKMDAGNAPIDRLVRVWYDRRVVEFRFCPFFTSFWRQTVIDEFECPAADLKGFSLLVDPPGRTGFTFIRSSAQLRIWTSRGYLSISGEVGPLKDLRNALRTMAGERPAPLLQRGWATMLIICVAAAVIIAVLWHFQII